ncbi:MAG: shikimate kinase [Clostridiales bacterium]|nr:shikimate kinase [Clostridiales bacterium]
MIQNIFLIGFMGAGKSSIARFLRDNYQMSLVEMDEQIESQEGRTISQIFAESGEEYFRALETKLLLSMAEQKNTVVSCGGGVPMRPENVAAMRQSGKIIYLCASPEEIYARVKNTHTRPLLEGNMNVEYIESMMKKRLPKYLEAADITVITDRKSIQEICTEILASVS